MDGEIALAAKYWYTISTMLQAIWTEGLFRPVFNFLIWIYNNWTNVNMGWAIVYLTIVLRLVLLPLTLIGERGKIRNEELVTELRGVEKTYSNDPVLQKEEMRRILKQRRVKPWAKAFVLGVQALVFILLYQVFVRGITGERMLAVLYDAVDFPGVINTDFYGFDLSARRDLMWSGAVGVFLYLQIYLESRKHKVRVHRGDLVYFLLFPLVVFLVLWWLPMVKSLFILTSLVFSAIVYQFSKVLFRRHKSTPSAA